MKILIFGNKNKPTIVWKVALYAKDKICPDIRFYFFNSRNVNAKKTYTVKTDYGDIAFWKNGNVIAAEGFLNNIPAGTSIQLPNEVAPGYNHAMLNELRPIPPYDSVGTAWIYSDGRMVTYASDSIVTIYVCGSYILL